MCVCVCVCVLVCVCVCVCVRASVCHSNLPAEPAEEAQKHQQQYEEMVFSMVHGALQHSPLYMQEMF